MSAGLPTGMVTFLFTDIGGSTRLLQVLGRGYPDLLEQHTAILRRAVAGHEGVEFGTEGDAFFAVFQSAVHEAAARQAIGDAVFEQRREEGEAMSVDEGVAYALSPTTWSTTQPWRSMPMPEPIFFLSHFRIKEGQLDLVRQLTNDGAARLQEEKPRTVLFLSYLDADGGTISFLHAFADAESMDLHNVGSGERSRMAYEYFEPLGWEVYGKPSSAALETLSQAADSASVSLKSHPEYLAGFLRLGPV